MLHSVELATIAIEIVFGFIVFIVVVVRLLHIDHVVVGFVLLASGVGLGLMLEVVIGGFSLSFILFRYVFA